MSFKNDLLRKLSVSKLKLLAEQNRISLIREKTTFADFRPKKYTLTDKNEIIEALLSSGKITEKKIRELIEPKKDKRDKRRTFTQTQKKQILYQQDNKCAICHKKLDPRAIEYDHKKPWAAGGRTITQNGRALDSECHTIVEHNKRLKKVG